MVPIELNNLKNKIQTSEYDGKIYKDSSHTLWHQHDHWQQLNSF